MDRVLVLHFIDGSKLSFEFEEQAASPAARKLKLDDFMSAQHLVIEAEGNVLVFPVSGIKYMAFSTPLLDMKGVAAALPRHAIVGARIRA
jgi:hypothetical protein